VSIFDHQAPSSGRPKPFQYGLGLAAEGDEPLSNKALSHSQLQGVVARSLQTERSLCLEEKRYGH